MEFVRHHRSLNAVIRAANKLDLYKPQGDWTEEEDAILTTYYKSEGEQTFSRLPNRSISALRARVLKLNLQKRFAWSEEEDKILIDHYPTQGPECFKLLSDRSEAACRSRVTTLNLHMEVRPTGALWTAAENEIIKTYYTAEGSAIIDRLPGRTAATIKRQARTLGIKYQGPKRRTGQKKVRCKETSVIYTSAKAAADILGISYKMIQANASGTKKSGGGYHWEYVEERDKNKDE